MNNDSSANYDDDDGDKLAVLASAQQQFEAVLDTFSSDNEQQREQFLRWVRNRINDDDNVVKKSSSHVPSTDDDRHKRHPNLAAVRKQLGRIAKRLRDLTPLEYCLDFPASANNEENCQEKQSPTTTKAQVQAVHHPTAGQQQHLVWPIDGMFADCTPHNTLHVDAFLFDDDDVDQMAADGIVRRHFCTKCHSTEVEQFNLISHSLTIDELHHLFTVRLPSLDGKVLVDIGSRLGAVLYAAALYCPRIGRVIGIEREPLLCELQRQIVAEFGMSSPPIELRCADVRDVGTTKGGDADGHDDDILAIADVVIMNNVFTFFADHAEQISCWQHLRAHLRPGTLLFHSPSLHLVTAHLCSSALGFAFDDWLQTLHIGTAANSAAVSVGTDTFSVYRIV